MQLDDSTLSRNLERMRISGWLEEVPGNNGRERPYRLTAKGRKLLEKATPAWSDAQEKARELLGDSGVEALWNFVRGNDFCS